MDLGMFSVSLAVRDLEDSREFYERLGFEIVGGNVEENWLMMHNGVAAIGLFQGMFENNILTFNPPDVRKVQRSLQKHATVFERAADLDSEGPAHAVLRDPDGNLILLDQF